MTQKKQLTLMNYAAILSIFLFSGAGSFMNAAVQTMMDAWPELSATTVRMVTSLPSLLSLPITVLIGGIAGKKLSHRFCAIFGTALILLGGIAPFFFYSSWTLILVFRALVGIGVGFVAMRNSLIIKTVPEDKQAAVIGYGSALMNAGGMLSGPIVGLLAGFGWRFPFLFDLLAIIPVMIMLFYLKEPEKETNNANINPENIINEKSGNIDVTNKFNSNTDIKNPTSAPQKNNWRVYYYVIMQFICTAALYPLLSGMSSYMASNEIGSSFVAGLTNSAYNLAGVLISLILNQLVKSLKQYMLPVMCGFFAIGMGIIVFFQNVPMIVVGAVIAGMTFNTMMSLFQLYNGKVATAQTVTFFSTLLIAALSLGNFVSVYFINFCHAIFQRSSDIESTYFGSMICYIILGVLALVLKVSPEYLEKENK